MKKTILSILIIICILTNVFATAVFASNNASNMEKIEIALQEFEKSATQKYKFINYYSGNDREPKYIPLIQLEEKRWISMGTKAWENSGHYAPAETIIDIFGGSIKYNDTADFAGNIEWNCDGLGKLGISFDLSNANEKEVYTSKVFMIGDTGEKESLLTSYMNILVHDDELKIMRYNNLVVINIDDFLKLSCMRVINSEIGKDTDISFELFRKKEEVKKDNQLNTDIDNQKISLNPQKPKSSSYKYPKFKDINISDEYADFILALGYLNLFKGDNKGNFNPESTITRAEFATIICRMLGYENDAEKCKDKVVFDDVPSNHWASGYIFVACQLGVINGYGNRLFGPEDPVLYEQAIKMLLCATGYNSVMICNSLGISCPDNEVPYPEGYLSIAEHFKLQDSNARPDGKASRKQVAKLLYLSLNLAVPVESNNKISFTGEPFLKNIFDIQSKEEFNKIIDDIKKVYSNISNDNKEDNVAKDEEKNTNPVNYGYLDIINSDYLKIKMKYGSLKETMSYEGMLYKLPDGNYVGFSGAYNENPTEPGPFDVASIVYCELNDIINGLENKNYSTKELSDYSGLKFSKPRYTEMTEEYITDATYNGVDICITLTADKVINKSCSTMLISHWKNSEYKKYSSKTGNLSECEKYGPFYYQGDMICKVDSSTSGEIIVPSDINGTNIISIAEDAFEGCNNITSVIISPGVKRIYSRAFKGMQNLEKVRIPTSVETIYSYAFSDCPKLKDIYIPNGVREIENKAFSGCTSLEYAKIPISITKLGYSVFENCPNIKCFAMIGYDWDHNYSITNIKSDVEVLVVAGDVSMLPLGYFSDSKGTGGNAVKSILIDSDIIGYNGSSFGSSLYGYEVKVHSSRPYKKDFEKFGWKSECYKEISSLFESEFLWRFIEDYGIPFLVVNDKIVFSEISPGYKSGDLMFAANDLFESLGMEVFNDKTGNSLEARGNANSVRITYGEKKAVINGKEVYLEESVALKNGMLMIPVKSMIQNLGGNAQWLKNNVLKVNIPIFRVENQDLIEACSKTDYSFDKLYQYYLENEKDYNVKSEFMNDTVYVCYLAAILTEVLISPETNVFEESYEVSKAAMELLPNTDVLGTLSPGIESSEKYARIEALKNVTFNLELLHDKTEDKYWKQAILFVKEKIEESKELLEKESKEEFLWKNYANYLGNEVLLDLCDYYQGFENLTNTGTVIKAFLDGLNGQETMEETHMAVMAMIPIRNGLYELCNEMLAKVDNGENALSDGRKVTDVYFDSARFLLQCMKYLSSQTHLSYSAQFNSGFDMLYKFFTLKLNEFYDGKYDVIYEEENKLFNSLLIK